VAALMAARNDKRHAAHYFAAAASRMTGTRARPREGPVRVRRRPFSKQSKVFARTAKRPAGRGMGPAPTRSAPARAAATIARKSLSSVRQRKVQQSVCTGILHAPMEPTGERRRGHGAPAGVRRG
jgi:hypothetical protein